MTNKNFSFYLQFPETFWSQVMCIHMCLYIQNLLCNESFDKLLVDIDYKSVTVIESQSLCG